MPGQVIGYARVSSVDQNLDRQLVQLGEAGIEKLFQDKISGSTSKRPGLDACKDYMREGDTLVVCSIDRLARNMFDLQKLIYEFQEQGITVRFLKENLLLAETPVRWTSYCLEYWAVSQNLNAP